MSFDFHALTEHLERLSSRRLSLRSLAPCDAWPLFQATRVPRFNEHLTWRQPQHEQEALERIDAILGASRRGEMCALSAVVRDTGEWVSLYRFQPSGRDAASLEVGVWTHPKFWHGRYSPELMKFCIDSAFERSEASEIVAAGAVENRGSIALMRVAGMKPIRSFHKELESGESIAALEFRLSRAEWLESKSSKRSRLASIVAPAESELLEAA